MSSIDFAVDLDGNVLGLAAPTWNASFGQYICPCGQPMGAYSVNHFNGGAVTFYYCFVNNHRWSKNLATNSWTANAEPLQG